MPLLKVAKNPEIKMISGFLMFFSNNYGYIPMTIEISVLLHPLFIL